MTISVVQSNVAQFSAYGSGNTASPSLTGVTAGNALVLVTINEMYSTSTLTGNHISVAGGGTWADLFQTSPNNCATNFYQQIDFEILYDVAAGSYSPTVTNSVGSGNVAGYAILMEVSGLATSAALDVTVSASGVTASSGTATVSTGTSSAVAQTTEISFAAFVGHDDAASNSWTGPGGYTNVYQATNGATQFLVGSLDYLTPISAGTQAASWTSTASLFNMGYQGALITLKQQAAGLSLNFGYISYAMSLQSVSLVLSSSYLMVLSPLVYSTTLAPNSNDYALYPQTIAYATTVENVAFAAPANSMIVQTITYSYSIGSIQLITSSQYYTLGQAIEILANAGFTVNPVIIWQYSSTVPYYYVISQLPVAGSVITYQATPVQLTVSLGPPNPKLTATVPNVVGDLTLQAMGALSQANLNVGTITWQVSGSYPINTVISQSVAGGTVVYQFTSINLVCCSGPPQDTLIDDDYTVPDVVNP